MKPKILSIINFVIVDYFVAIYLINYYRIDFAIIGVFRELLTIPFMLVQIVFLFLGLRLMFQKKQFPFLFLFSFIALVICSAITIGSFF